MLTYRYGTDVLFCRGRRFLDRRTDAAMSPTTRAHSCPARAGASPCATTVALSAAPEFRPTLPSRAPRETCASAPPCNSFRPHTFRTRVAGSPWTRDDRGRDEIRFASETISLEPHRTTCQHTYLCPCQLAGADFFAAARPLWNGGEGRGCRGRGLVPLTPPSGEARPARCRQDALWQEPPLAPPCGVRFAGVVQLCRGFGFASSCAPRHQLSRAICATKRLHSRPRSTVRCSPRRKRRGVGRPFRWQTSAKEWIVRLPPGSLATAFDPFGHAALATLAGGLHPQPRQLRLGRSRAWRSGRARC